MKKKYLYNIALAFACLLSIGHINAQSTKADAEVLKRLDNYNVFWNTPSGNSKGSMPIGNGDIGLNVWVEKTGDLLFYIGKSDSWSENPSTTEGLLKIGRMRLHINGNPLKEGAFSSQVLDLRTGTITIKGNNNLTLKVWVDANHPVIHVDAASLQPDEYTLSFESLRTPAIQAAKDSLLRSKLHIDDIIANQPNKIAWVYQNQNKKTPQLTNLKFGAIAQGDGLVTKDETTLVSSSPQKKSNISITVATNNEPTINGWQQIALSKMRDATLFTADYEAHKRWWNAFWNRSWVFLDGDKDAETITRAYILQRFVSACAGRGNYAIKYNGSIFTMDDTLLLADKNKMKHPVAVNGDFRSWGGSYWMQNTRHMYWPMLAAGDFDLLQPFFNMYLNMVPGNKEAVKNMYGVNGVCFAETSPFYGLVAEAKDDSKPGYVQHYYTQSLELLAMMLDYYNYSGDVDFAKTKLLPLADDALRFFTERFKKDATGKLVFYPDNAMETYWKAKNPATDIAGFTYIIKTLLALPDNLVSTQRRSTWQQYLAIAPDLPMGTKNGKPVIAVAEQTDSIRHNTENPELYTIFPFRVYGLNKPDLQLAKNTFNERMIKTVGCWHHDILSAALLGETEAAKNELIKICSLKNAKDKKDNDFRFPAFWGPGHDYSPDEDHGGVLQNALQLMLLQCVGNDVLLLPAFPKQWNVNFKLHTEGQSTVRVEWKDGKMVSSAIETASGKKLKMVNE
ncbi:DUF5703 domain-containing protein [Parasediminibacterium sp. JCM 36343]|uniref:DUF5703 domain-containing protein n=1 Tax=Parasediminibacterium sp. JCM 36343 TaxID=3374279 RepID=UPI00397D5858